MDVITSWSGIAGAGVGIAACLPQAPGVLRSEYPTGDDLNVGGARTNRVRIISPEYEKVCFGIDDTDTKTEGATWVMALKCTESCRVEGVEFLNMRLVQLKPKVPQKTTDCVGSALNFAVKPHDGLTGFPTGENRDNDCARWRSMKQKCWELNLLTRLQKKEGSGHPVRYYGETGG